ncbi:26S proteasome non-ATPase regulatory subunit 7 [Culex quinquefasciatus]|uniref:26S proteasome non-ATPase regulatory subunit 7 n=1 Tax=Culex quinquefasciatus TaxID=7176 RepID=B0XCU4_CULQU|nr:26S proteasome non-ATPase regulatory subunit 7 [Culex quinquefasciatus]|eukprot:XP_001867466.1 26S proteasome non-ATPase regulatory subunit 7 [Culex quinquefasciatus]
MLSETSVTKVIVHPLVLLSVVDHFKRKLLGCWRAKCVLDVSNSFEVAFDEDDKDKSVWFLDHDYLENTYGIFKKVNVRERLLCQNDISINKLIRRYYSVLVLIDAKPNDQGLPPEVYIAVEEVHDDGSPTSKTFEHVGNGQLPVNHQIVYQLQDILNLLPDLAQENFTNTQCVEMNGKEKEKDDRDGEKEEKEKKLREREL